MVILLKFLKIWLKKMIKKNKIVKVNDYYIFYF